MWHIKRFIKNLKKKKKNILDNQLNENQIDVWNGVPGLFYPTRVMFL
jgi:hypothetical protein